MDSNFRFWREGLGFRALVCSVNSLPFRSVHTSLLGPDALLTCDDSPMNGLLTGLCGAWSTLPTVALVMILSGIRSHGYWPSPASRPIAPPASVLAQRRSTSRGAALADGIGRLAERFAGLARRSGYPHSETPGAVSPLYRHSAREIRTITERPPDAPRATAWQNA
jgi:hypothetical protein